MTDGIALGTGGDFLRSDKKERTDMYCHDCGKNFLAIIDFSVNGNHIAQCPHCGHKHFRHVKDGKVTGDRWQSDGTSHTDVTRKGAAARSVWKPEGDVLVPIGDTMSGKDFLRRRWLEKGS